MSPNSGEIPAKSESDGSPRPSNAGPGNFRNYASTQAEEDAFDFKKYRNTAKLTGTIGTIANIVKGALGGGILGSHVGYMKAGWYLATPLHLILGVYLGYCLYMLGNSAQVLYRRTRVPSLTYPEVGEAAMACFPNPKVAKMSKLFRYIITSVINFELFGSCACYQILMAKSIKQLVENTQRSSVEGLGPGYPHLRVYLMCMLAPVILICLIRHLKYLAPFSILANAIILFCCSMTVYYAMKFNPGFQNMVGYTTVYNLFEFFSICVFSMSCSGIIVSVENNMLEPQKFGFAMFFGMAFIILFTFSVSLFGYVGFLEHCESPITVNFPMETLPIVMKVGIAVMIYITHALNFWVPFNLTFDYIKPYHNENRIIMWEYIYRVIFVIAVCLIAIVFPNVNALMGLLGAFCVSNMAFIWPNLIYLMTVWERPGLGRFKWRLWRTIFLSSIGIFIMIIGTIINANELLTMFRSDVKFNYTFHT